MRLLLALAAALPVASVNITLTLLQRITDARFTAASTCRSGWRNETCWMDAGWQAVAVAGLLAAHHFNTRDGRFVPAFASPEMAKCDKKFTVYVLDTQSEGLPTLAALVEKFQQDIRPDVMVGPGRSDVALTIAAIAGLEGIPMISYWATSPLLDSVRRYPLFMRTVPADDAVARTTCVFWKVDMQFSKAAVLYLNDAYGDGFTQAVLRHCVADEQMRIDTFSFEGGSRDQVRDAVELLYDTNTNVVLVIAIGDDNRLVVEEAVARGAMKAPCLWSFADGVTDSDIDAFTGDARDAVTGSVRIVTGGASEDNPRWRRFVKEWPQLAPLLPRFESFLPDGWGLDPTLFSEFDVNSSSAVRDIATFEYDAMAAAALLSCAAAPTGPLDPKTFGAEFFAYRQDRPFDGLSGEVDFSGLGNRQFRGAQYVLSNVLPAGDQADGPLKFVQKATFEGGAWVWAAGKIDLVYNFGEDTPPIQGGGESEAEQLRRVLLAIMLVIFGCIFAVILGLAILKLRIVSARFGVSPVTLITILIRRRFRRRPRRLPKMLSAQPMLEIALYGEKQLLDLFHSYVAQDSDRMSLHDWLRFHRVEQGEKDESAATNAFYRIVDPDGATRGSAHAQVSASSGSSLAGLARHSVAKNLAVFRTRRTSTVQGQNPATIGEEVSQQSEWTEESNAVPGRGRFWGRVGLRSVRNDTPMTDRNDSDCRQRRSTAKSELGLSYSEFALALVSSSNKATSPSLVELQHDTLSHPLSHFWIASSHNSYLTGHQLTSESSADMYRRQLLQGVRCLEIDIWDGSRASGPIVTHGYTLVKSDTLRRVAVAVQEDAFKTSPLPVILTLEVKASAKQQVKAAEIFREVFGEQLLLADDEDGLRLATLPIEQLRGRILIRGKTWRGNALLQQLRGDPAVIARTISGGSPRHFGVSSVDDDEEDEQSRVEAAREQSAGLLRWRWFLWRAQRRSNKQHVSQSMGSSRHKRGSLPKPATMRLHDPAIQMIVTVHTLPAEGFSSALFGPRVFQSGNSYDADSTPLTATSFSEDKWLQPRRQALGPPSIDQGVDEKLNKNSASTTRALMGASIAGSSIAGPSIAGPASRLFGRRWSAPSMSVGVSAHFLDTSAAPSSRSDEDGNTSADIDRAHEQQRQTRERIARIFPRGTRTKSDNFDPLQYWACGAQMCALNLQTNDLPSQLHHALFELNGGSGYVLKPPEMLQPVPAWPPPRLKLHVTTVRPISLFQLPGRGKQRPQLAGPRQRVHECVPELSYDSRACGREADSDLVRYPTLVFELHSLGGFHAVSTSLPPCEAATRGKVRAISSSGRDSHYQQKVHLVAAEPLVNILRVSVVDDETHQEVAYETVVLGALRPGYRIFHLRSMHGTRIESCYLLVHLRFTTQVNAWVGEKEIAVALCKQEAIVSVCREKIRELESELGVEAPWSPPRGSGVLGGGIQSERTTAGAV